MQITEFKGTYKDFFPVGAGWRPLVEKLVDDIIAIDQEVEVLQVKEKFGGLRFYVGGASEEVYALIGKAEEESFKICERCGTNDNVSTKGGWLLTLCDKCREAKK